MKRAVWVAVLIGVGCLGFAQDKEGLNVKPKPVTIDLSKSILTQEDLSISINRLDAAMRKVLKFKKVELVDSKVKTPASREQVIREFHRLFTMAKGSFKFTPKKITFDSNLVSIRSELPERAMLERLIAMQFIAKVGPIAANKTPGLTLYEFGDALGFFIARIADLTHTPNSKWSPYLQSEGAPSRQGVDKSKQVPKVK